MTSEEQDAQRIALVATLATTIYAHGNGEIDPTITVRTGENFNDLVIRSAIRDARKIVRLAEEAEGDS